jgi:hypothetical protein
VRRHAAVVLPLLLACLPSRPIAGDEAWSAWASQPPAPAGPSALEHRALHARARAWRALAAEGTAEALEGLIGAYERAGEPAQGRSLAASIAVRAFGTTQGPRLELWRASADGPEHHWLWYVTLRAEVLRGVTATALRLAQDGNAAWQRAVAIHALAGNVPERPHDGHRGLLQLPSQAVDRALVLEALSALWAALPPAASPAWRRTFGVWLVERLDAPETLDRSRLRIVRDLARGLRRPASTLEATYWRAALEDASRASDDGARYAPPPTARFLDLTSVGGRVAYVVDVSGSMDERLTAHERLELGRLSGARPAVWDAARTRLGAAVELLRTSLRALPRHARFTIVLFASKHAFLRATPGLVPATPANVAGAQRELDRLVRAEVTALGVGTNLHGGLLRGLDARVGSRQGAPDPLRDLLDGADTVFLLSDGCPSEDDWSDEDPRRRPSGQFDPHAALGTYVDGAQLLQDVARINLLRRCEIHAVSLGRDVHGEALRGDDGAAGPEELLEALVRVGSGKWSAVPQR